MPVLTDDPKILAPEAVSMPEDLGLGCSPAAEIRLADIPSEQRFELVELFARAFVDNPIHLAAFGRQRDQVILHNELLFDRQARHLAGRIVGAFDGDRLVGVAHWITHKRGRTSLRRRVKLGVDYWRAFKALAPRLLSWRRALRTQEPGFEHCHLGPLVVAPEAQGGQIGRRLIRAFCEHLDATGETGVLETDRRRHIAFYKEQGFEVVREFRVLGAQVWQLHRSPQAR